MLEKINRILLRGYMPVSLKYISLIAYTLLIITGLSAFSTDPAVLQQLRNTNLGNLVVWSYWWPAIVFLAIFFGRIWCMVCPVEVVTTFFARIGLKRKRPAWLLSGWVITAFYMFILLAGIQGFAIHRNPYYMSMYLLMIAGVSVIIGSIYEKNTFCRYVCPVGYLLGLYSRFSFFGWRVKDVRTCKTCRDKSCIHRSFRYNLNMKSCGVDLYPAVISDNSDCILCAGCMKTCANHQSQPDSARPNPMLTYIGFANDLFKLKPLKVAEMVFVLVVSGFVISEIWSEWSVTGGFLEYLPGMLVGPLPVPGKAGTVLVKGLSLFLFFPLIIWLLPFLISRLCGSGLRIKEYFLNYGIAFIPIIAAAHLGKSVLKTTSRIPYFEHLTDDISGNSTAEKIIDGTIILHQNPVWLNILVSALLTLFILAGIWLSVKVVTRLNQKHEGANAGSLLYMIPVIYGSIFLLMIIAWRWIS